MSANDVPERKRRHPRLEIVIVEQHGTSRRHFSVGPDHLAAITTENIRWFASGETETDASRRSGGFLGICGPREGSIR
jgi:hypothetical protein